MTSAVSTPEPIPSELIVPAMINPFYLALYLLHIISTKVEETLVLLTFKAF
jgi:hypothetical protein